MNVWNRFHLLWNNDYLARTTKSSRRLLFLYRKRKRSKHEKSILTKKNLKNYYAGHLKGLPSNLLKDLTTDLRQQYQLQKKLVFSETAEQRLERAKEHC